MEQKRTPSQLLFSILFYIAGLFILAFGVAISVNAQMGISPVNSLPYVVSLITSVNLGTCVTIVFSVYLLIQLLLLCLSPSAIGSRSRYRHHRPTGGQGGVTAQATPIPHHESPLLWDFCTG